MTIMYLRRARRICQLGTHDVQRMTGLDFATIHQAEIADRADEETAGILWELYAENEKPSRFEGKLQTVSELKEAYYDQFVEDEPG